jgi:hypothetical protein
MRPLPALRLFGVIVTCSLAGCGSRAPHTLSGVLVADPSELNLGEVTLGKRAQGVITLTNQGSAAVSISSFSVTGSGAGAFSLAGADAASLGPSEQLKLTVTFAPQVAGNTSATLSAATDADNTVELTVALSGVGKAGATRLVFVTQPADVAAASPLPGLVVEAQDEAGAPVTDESRTVTMALGANPTGATLAGTLTASFTQGRATFSGLSIATAGAGYTLSAVIAAGPSAISVPFNVTPGPAAKLKFEVQPRDVAAGAMLTPPVVVDVTDAAGNLLSAATPVVTLSLVAGSGPGALLGTAQQSALDGRATFSNLSVAVAGGPYTLKASSAGLADAESSAFSVAPGAPARLRFIDAPANGVAGVTLPPLRVQVEDASGNLVTSASTQIDLALTGAGAPLLGTLSVAAGAGVATFDDLRLDRAGHGYTLEAGSASLLGATSAPFDVAPAAIAGAPHSTLQASPSSVVADGAAVATVTFTARDGFDNPLPGVGVALSATGLANVLTPVMGSTDASGVLIAQWSSTYAGSKSVTATAGPVQQTAPVTFTAPVCLGSELLPGLPGIPLPGAAGDLAVADFNADGLTDVLTVVSGAPRVAVSQDGGTYAVTAVGVASAVAVATADFNRDGKPDIVVGNGTSTTVEVGNGSGAFSPTATLGAASAIAVGLFNADGNPDLAFTNSGTTMTLALGDGSGGFAGPLTYAIAGGTAGHAMVAVDLDNDSKSDLVIATSGGLSVSLFGGTGFWPATAVPLSPAPVALAAGHVDADLNTDLVVVYTSGDGALLRGLGNGAFAAPSPLSLGAATQLSLLDVDGDGHVDLLYARGGDVVARLGDGAGAFGGEIVSHVGPVITRLAPARLDRDAVPDVAINAVNQAQIMRLRGDGHGAFAVSDSYGVGVKVRALSVTDLDGDGLLDVVSGGGPNVQAFLGLADGGFTQSAALTTVGLQYQVAVADVTLDGVPDLISTSFVGPSQLSIFKGLGKGQFASPVALFTGGNAVGMVVRDFNGDGAPDIAATNWNSNSISVLIAAGDGGYLPSVVQNVGTSTWGIVAADFGGDGKLDLAVGGNALFTFKGNGDGTFQPAVTVEAGLAGANLDVADINGDGFLDLIAVDRGYGGRVNTYLGHGDGSFASKLVTPSVTAPTDVKLADLNGDGKLDALVTTETELAAVSVHRGNGDGTFQPAELLPSDSVTAGVVAVDLNHDGRLDLVTANGTTATTSVGGATRVLYNRGCWVP